MKHRTKRVDGAWCKRCNEEAFGGCCEKCGATSTNGGLNPWAVVLQQWTQEKRIWYKPSTWFPYWKSIKVVSER